jgi:plastocyanin
MSLHLRTAAALALLIAGIAAACSGDAYGPGGGGTNPDCIAPTTQNFADSTRGRVIMRGQAFIQSDITIRAGTSVAWVFCDNPGTDSHTVTSDTQLWDSGLVGSGTFTRTFPAAGTFPYHCLPHPGMVGVIRVID